MAQSSHNGQSEHTSPVHQVKFSNHNFGFACFNATNCEVIYADRLITAVSPRKPTSAPTTNDLRNIGAHHIAIHNFPPPAIVTWKSSDGLSRKAEVDLGAIFSDQKIKHDVRPDDIPVNAHITAPDIILVVNDRSIRVYMRAYVPLKAPKDPANPLSNFAEDAVLTFSQDY